MPSASFVWRRGSCEHCESQGLGEASLLGGRAHVHPSALASKAWSLPWGQLQWGHSWTKPPSPLVAAGLTDSSDPAPSHPCDSGLWVPASGSHTAWWPSTLRLQQSWVPTTLPANFSPCWSRNKQTEGPVWPTWGSWSGRLPP